MRSPNSAVLPWRQRPDADVPRSSDQRGGRAVHVAAGHILIAGCDSDTRALYRTAFEIEGHTVVEAGDGRDALVKALTNPPSLVITETHLPLMDGYSLCEILRRDPATRLVPILVVTSEAAPHIVQQARTVGASAVLVKGSRLDAILDEVRRLIESRSRGENHAEGNGAVDAPAPQANGSARGRVRATRSRMHARFNTTMPAASPPDLHCPNCDGTLVYHYSHIGGVSSRHAEQWDYYSCSSCSNAFEYRQRTKKLRRVDGAVVESR